MNDRPPVFDPRAPKGSMNLIGKIVVGVFVACGMVFVGLVILMCIAMSMAGYGNNK